MRTSDYIVLSLGGSVIIPKTGFDPAYLRALHDCLLLHIHAGKRFIIVVGGGATARVYQQALKQTDLSSPEDLDFVGIRATHLNAELVRVLFGAMAHSELIRDPRKKVRSHAAVLVSGGWKPGASTDTVAIELAHTFRAKKVINISNTRGVYTADPSTDTEAAYLPTLTWKRYREEILQDVTWSPGSRFPFDPVASRMAENFRLSVGFVDGGNLTALSQAIEGTSFDGTIISP